MSAAQVRQVAQLAAGAGRAAGACLPRVSAALPGPATCHRSGCSSGESTAVGGAAVAAAQQHLHLYQPQTRGRPCRASYNVVTSGGDDGSSGSSGSSAQQQPWRLIVYSKEGCHLCDGLKDKLHALLERAAFLPSSFSTAELEVRDIRSNPEWEQRYAMSIPVLAAAAADGTGEVEVPRPSPRVTADTLQNHIEKFLAKHPQLLGGP